MNDDQTRRWNPYTEPANVDESCDIALITPPPIGERSIVMNMSVCLSVCVCVHALVCPGSYLRNYVPSSPNFFTRATYGRGLVLLWRHNDMLCTSGFMDDVIFAHKPRLLDVTAQLKRSS